MAASNALSWLTSWYAAQCNGDWEHHFGVTLGTLDNPGWSLRIDLEGTDFEEQAFKRVTRELANSENGGSWSVCSVEEKQFRADCGALDLAEVIEIFQQWIEA